jgi:hypothetical protein
VLAIIAVQFTLTKRSLARNRLRRLQTSEELLATSKCSMGQDKQGAKEQEIEEIGDEPCEWFAESVLVKHCFYHF